MVCLNWEMNTYAKISNIRKENIPAQVFLAYGYPFVRRVAGELNISNSLKNFFTKLIILSCLLYNFVLQIIYLIFNL